VVSTKAFLAVDEDDKKWQENDRSGMEKNPLLVSLISFVPFT